MKNYKLLVKYNRPTRPKRVLFVGLCPSKKNLSPEIAFLGTQSFTRLVKLVHDVKLDGCYDYSFINLYFDIEKTRQNRRVDQSWKYFDKIVLLGKEVNERLNLAAEYMPSKFIYIPHPSGLNRIWNNKKNYEIVVQTLEEFLK